MSFPTDFGWDGPLKQPPLFGWLKHAPDMLPALGTFKHAGLRISARPTSRHGRIMVAVGRGAQTGVLIKNAEALERLVRPADLCAVVVTRLRFHQVKVALHATTR